jgi:hypothetical protein
MYIPGSAEEERFDSSRERLSSNEIHEKSRHGDEKRKTDID